MNLRGPTPFLTPQMYYTVDNGTFGCHTLKKSLKCQNLSVYQQKKWQSISQKNLSQSDEKL